MDELIRAFGAWRPFRVIVVGDFMLDEQVYGDAERLSADAPVPVLRVRDRAHNPGGAASLAMDLAAMRGYVTVVGVVGDDASAGVLAGAMRDAGLDTVGLVTDATRPTTVKRNLVGLAQQRHPQKMFRLDEESREPLGTDVEGAVLTAFERALAEGADAVCIEDYAKGVCTNGVCAGVIEGARAAGVPVFVDPANLDDYTRYAGATAITPNRNEAERATGLATCADGSEAQNARVAECLQELLSSDVVVLTLDRHGALLLERGCEPVVVPTGARDVYDVTGAGDMFIAGLTAGRAQGLGWEDATRLANLAAGLEVEVFGVAPIPLARLHHAALEHRRAERGKVRTNEELEHEVEAWRAAGKRIAFTNGCFDVLHAGHIHLLEAARGEADVLIVATNADETVRRYKGANRPVNALADRLRVLGALEAVNALVVFEEDTPQALIERVRPDVLVKGDEYTLGEIPGASFVERSGGRVVRVPMRAGMSSSEVLRRSGDPRAEVASDASSRERFIADRPAT